MRMEADKKEWMKRKKKEKSTRMNTTPSGKDPSSSGEKRKKQEKLLYPCRDFRKNTERICLWGALCPAGVTLFREIASGGFFQAGLLRLILAWCLIELVIFLLLKLLFVMQDSKSIREILEWLREDASPGRVRQAWKYLSETKGAHLCPPVFDEPVTRILTGRIMLSAAEDAGDRENAVLAQRIIRSAIEDAGEKLLPAVSCPLPELVRNYDLYANPASPVRRIHRILHSRGLKLSFLALLSLIFLCYLALLFRNARPGPEEGTAAPPEEKKTVRMIENESVRQETTLPGLSGERGESADN